MILKQLTVGPIVGATSHESVRLFGRGKWELSDERPRRAHGVARIRKVGQNKFSAPQYFKLNPNFDMTGVTVFQGLKGNTSYEYQMGWLFSDVDTDTIDVGSLLDWSDLETHTFRSASNNKLEPRTIALGSCRYALRMGGGYWYDDRGDKTFRSILRQIASGKRVDQFIMCGDQIYADDLKFLGADNELDEFNARYRKVFTTEHLRKLMSQVPTYMTLDDHEIEDNWPENANKKDWVTKFPAAIHAYATYQGSHSPLFSLGNGRLDGTPTHLWYTYTDGCCDFFFCDTRTERNLEDDEREMVGPHQLRELLKWLDNKSGRVKVIVTSVPFYEHEGEDKWNGFVDQRDEILECIRKKKIRRVVLMSGDVHASMASELALDGDPKFKIVSIVSSAFFWPYPHPRRRKFLLKGDIKSETGQRYFVRNSSSIYPTDAFVRTEIDPSKVNVWFYTRKGKQLAKKGISF